MCICSWWSRRFSRMLKRSGVAGTIPVLAQRAARRMEARPGASCSRNAHVECARSTRAVEGAWPPLNNEMENRKTSHRDNRHVSACQWAGRVKVGLFEHPADAG